MKFGDIIASNEDLNAGAAGQVSDIEKEGRSNLELLEVPERLNVENLEDLREDLEANQFVATESLTQGYLLKEAHDLLQSDQSLGELSKRLLTKQVSTIESIVCGKGGFSLPEVVTLEDLDSVASKTMKYVLASVAAAERVNTKFQKAGDLQSLQKTLESVKSINERSKRSDESVRPSLDPQKFSEIVGQKYINGYTSEEIYDYLVSNQDFKGPVSKTCINLMVKGFSSLNLSTRREYRPEDTTALESFIDIVVELQTQVLKLVTLTEDIARPIGEGEDALQTANDGIVKELARLKHMLSQVAKTDGAGVSRVYVCKDYPAFEVHANGTSRASIKSDGGATLTSASAGDLAFFIAKDVLKKFAKVKANMQELSDKSNGIKTVLENSAKTQGIQVFNQEALLSKIVVSTCQATQLACVASFAALSAVLSFTAAASHVAKASSVAVELV